jgi:3-isopropylmalate dehydratase small subunit
MVDIFLPKYDYTNPLWVGGEIGTFVVNSPFGSSCEYAVVGVFFLDEGVCIVSDASFSSIQVGNAPRNGVPVFFARGAANTSQTFSDFWFSCSRDLTVQLTSASYLVLAFRRKTEIRHTLMPLVADDLVEEEQVLRASKKKIEKLGGMLQNAR